jgi:hypothetical protein
MAKSARLNQRGSPEAVAKRRAGRSFNDVLTHAGSTTLGDGRTEKRRQRLVKELNDGKTRTGRALKPLDVLLRVQELLALGETATSLRKAMKVKKRARVGGPEVVVAVRELHRAYAFPTEAYGFVGIGSDTLHEAGVLEGRGEGRGAARKRGTPARKGRGR